MAALQKTDRLRAMMKAYEGAQHVVVGVAASSDDRQVVQSGPKIPDTPSEDVVFEIGSITKVFTAILLNVLVEEGKVDPRAPLRDMSDTLADVPSWITPESLTSHTSGLPRIHVPIWRALIKPLPKDPYATFSRADLLAWCKAYQGKDPGGKRRHAYSNLGVGLLGEALSLHANKPYFDLLVDKVLGPLGLTDTTERLDDDQQRRFAQPRNTQGRAVVPWTFQSMAAAGCLRSTARDLARFACHVSRALNAPDTLLDQAICRSAIPIFGLGPRGRMEPTAQCSGWISMTLDKTQPGYLYHDGGTAGSTCALYICPDKAEACAILSNNGVGANLWASAKLSWSNQLRQAHDYFQAD